MWINKRLLPLEEGAFGCTRETPIAQCHTWVVFTLESFTPVRHNQKFLDDVLLISWGGEGKEKKKKKRRLVIFFCLILSELSAVANR